jgi:hypothetical protein
MRTQTFLLALATLLGGFSLHAQQDEPGFVSLFDGKTLDGWQLVGRKGPGYVVKDGVLVCPREGGGNLLTEKQYSNFKFRFEFKLTTNANNGVGIRAPLEGDAAYLGMEIQVLDDQGPQWKDKLRPNQYHGSIYNVLPAKGGALRPTGEWNQQEIMADGRRIRVILNDQIILDENLNYVNDRAVIQKHPGLFREAGHIGFLGHDAHVEFRNIRIQELASPEKDNTPPRGFMPLFNGNDLSGWKGLVADPVQRARMSPAQLQAAQAKADERMRAHWKVAEGVLVFDGKGDNLCTEQDYADFELLVDWKIEEKGDSGIYLRGTPQVQIWDVADTKGNPKGLGSGGLFNNEKNPSGPLRFADRPVGQWNRFRILMAGEKVHVFLNGQLVVQNTTLENFWERNKPIYPSGAIELQNHGNNLYFKNIYVREIQPD